jgi:3-hydroxyacyl-CoA dehydrogenase
MNRIAIIGAGVMGSQIGALFAAAGFHVDLLDVDEKLAAEGKQRLTKLRPSPLHATADLEGIHPGSLERPLPPADWYLEAAVEDLQVKRNLMARIEAEGSPGAIVSTNTSSLSVAAIAQGRPVVGVHFFNPPRYLPLVEVIGDAPEVVRILTTRLGKRVVLAHDTPRFIANRIGGAAIAAVLAAVEATGTAIDEADAITGLPLGRSRSGTFRTLDLVGLDTVQRINPNLPEWIREMIRRGWLGEKAGQGFYKRQGGEILVIDPKTLEYRPRQRTRITEPLERLVYANPFAWACVAPVLRFAAASIPEAADSPQQIDDAMRWGYSWSLGPFEVWERIGVRKAADRLRAEGGPLPPVAESLAADAFYTHDQVWAGAWIPRARDLRDLSPADLPAVWQTADADLRDLGGGVACLHLHPDHDALGPATIGAIRRATEEVGGSPRWRALVLLGSSPERFSVGANLQLMLFALDDEDWAEADRQIRTFQDTTMALRHLDRPVVAALAGMALGGGCELCLASDRIQAAAESYIGLVELGAGLVPAGGGCKELVRRANGSPRRIALALETVGQAKVSESARHAREIGYLSPADGISLDAAHRLADARDAALLLAESGYAPPRADETFAVLGRDGRAALMLAVQEQRWAGRISEYDAELGATLATVLTGGDVPAGTRVRAQHILDLERESFLKLLRNPLTQARMRHVLQTGRPLRN